MILNLAGPREWEGQGTVSPKRDGVKEACAASLLSIMSFYLEYYKIIFSYFKPQKGKLD